jgi:phosphopantetheine--protein transferase-like protein
VIGIDLVNVDDFRRQLEAAGESFVANAFNEDEVTEEGVDFLATLWAAKEAVVKAALDPPTNLKEIVIFPNECGRLAARIGGHCFELSLSHYGAYVVAVAMAIES